MAKLSYEEREELPDRAFADRERRAYPVPTVRELREVGAIDPEESGPSHARNALARVAQHGSPEQKREVCRLIQERYPEVHATHCPIHGSMHRRHRREEKSGYFSSLRRRVSR